MIATAAAARFQAGIGPAFVSTLLTDAVSGVTSASPTAVTADELLDLVASVDEAYAVNGSWCMRLSTLLALWKLKASSGGDYLFPAGQRDLQGRPLLAGFPVYLCPSMPQMVANATPVSFGNHNRFYRRQVRNSLQVRTYVERYAEYGQVAWEVFWRVDGHLMLAPPYGSPLVSQSPVKYLTMHS